MNDIKRQTLRAMVILFRRISWQGVAWQGAARRGKARLHHPVSCESGDSFNNSHGGAWRGVARRGGAGRGGATSSPSLSRAGTVSIIRVARPGSTGRGLARRGVAGLGMATSSLFFRDRGQFQTVV